MNRKHILAIALALTILLAGCSGWGDDGPNNNDSEEPDQSDDLEDAQDDSNTEETSDSSSESGESESADSSDSESTGSESSDSDSGDSSETTDSEDTPPEREDGDSIGDTEDSPADSESESGDSDTEETTDDNTSDESDTSDEETTDDTTDSGDETSDSSDDTDSDSGSGDDGDSDDSTADDGTSDDSSDDSDSSDGTDGDTGDSNDGSGDDSSGDDGDSNGDSGDGDGDEPTEPETYDVDVQVEDRDGTIEGGTITLNGETQEMNNPDVNTFEDVPEGEHTVTAEAEGYEDFEGTVTVERERQMPYMVMMDRKTPDTHPVDITIQTPEIAQFAPGIYLDVTSEDGDVGTFPELIQDGEGYDIAPGTYQIESSIEDDSPYYIENSPEEVTIGGQTELVWEVGVETDTIDVEVIDAVSGEPLEGATVYAGNHGGETDADGMASIEVIDDGTYSVDVGAENYYTEATTADPGDSVTVELQPEDGANPGDATSEPGDQTGDAAA